MKYLLGIDIGTTGTKTIVFRENGQCCGSAYCGYVVVNERADWAEQNPEDWWDAVAATVRKATAGLPDLENIAALSLSTQGGSLVVLDVDGNALTPAVSWMDRRAGQAELDMVRQGKETDYHYFHTGWKLTNSFNLVQIAWLRNHRPEVFEKAAKFLSTSDYINYRLTGQFVTDYTSAGITNMEEIARLDWDVHAFTDLSIRRDQVGQLLPSGSIIGPLSAAAAEKLGIPQKTMVVNGGMDQYCGAVGSGAIQTGDLMLATGTAWVILGTFSDMLFDSQSYIAPCPHILPGKFGAMATVPTGGVAMEWFRETFRASAESDLETFGQIDRDAAKIAPGSDGLLFYPHFSGATCPSWNMRNRAGFIGVHLGHRRAHFARAVMEGIAFAANDIIRALEQSGGAVGRIKLIGGAAKSDLWCNIVANVTGLPVLRPTLANAACTGAAMVAGVGVGLYPDYETAQTRLNTMSEPILPDAVDYALYQKALADYQNGFRHLSAYYQERG
jgi:sugar (pentulose or hexulose) kinase